MYKQIQRAEKVLTSITVTNRADEHLAKAGVIQNDQIRSETIRNVLVDQRVTTICLPVDIIRKLGLTLYKEVDVRTTTGISKTRIYRDLRISICGREGTFECLELPEKQDAQLGAVPLNALGIEVDLKHQNLKVLPTEFYLTV